MKMCEMYKPIHSTPLAGQDSRWITALGEQEKNILDISKYKSKHLNHSFSMPKVSVWPGGNL